MNGRQRVLALLEGDEPDHLPAMPITMMFAADQIGVPYSDYVTDHRVLVEAQVATATTFDFDHVSAISDPAREAADLGATVERFDDQPPAVAGDAALLAKKGALSGLMCVDPLGGGRMTDRVEAIALLVHEIGDEKVVEGWVEGPCAQGANLRGINTLMLDFHDDPTFVADLFEFTLDLELRFARAQVDAGADLIGVGDAAASLVGPAVYEEFVLPFERRLVDAIHDMGGRVRMHICGRTGKLLGGLGGLGAEILDLDSMVPLANARRLADPQQVLLGNLDPVAVVRNSDPEEITDRLARCHRDAGSRYVVGAGCELVRDSPHENVRAMIDFAVSRRPGDAPTSTGSVDG